jgi:hypothetical protein
MRLSSSWWRIVKLSSWVLINSQSPSVPVEEEDDKRPENEYAVALRKGRLVWHGPKRTAKRGHGRWNISACSFSRQEAFWCNVLSDSKVYFSLLRKLSSTSSDGVRSGNLDVRLPLVAFFFWTTHAWLFPEI